MGAVAIVVVVAITVCGGRAVDAEEVLQLRREMGGVIGGVFLRGQ